MPNGNSYRPSRRASGAALLVALSWLFLACGGGGNSVESIDIGSELPSLIDIQETSLEETGAEASAPEIDATKPEGTTAEVLEVVEAPDLVELSEVEAPVEAGEVAEPGPEINETIEPLEIIEEAEVGEETEIKEIEEQAETLSCDGDEDCVGVLEEGDFCRRVRCLEGGCVVEALADGQACADGDACTVADACLSGECTGAPRACADGNPCTEDSCDPNAGCVFTAMVAGACDDQSVCTVEDHCADGVCTGSLVDCDDGEVCTSDTCDASLGCQNLPAEGPCDDDSTCSENDRCVEGACAGDPVNCDDGNSCTDDACVEGEGCASVDNVASCDDLNSCTNADTCAHGTCIGEPVVCDGPPDAECQADAVSLLVFDPVGLCGPDGVCMYGGHVIPCEGACSDGACLGEPCGSVLCETPPSPCFASQGDCVGGACHYDYADGAACDDLEPCTELDRCTDGVCIGRLRICDTPPSNECESPTTLRRYDITGVCESAVGDCVYPSTEIACSAGCIDDVCLDALGLQQSVLSAVGAVDLESVLFGLRSVMTPWHCPELEMSSTNWTLIGGFQP